jgi:hypothetical protein
MDETSSTENRIYEDLDEWLDDKEPTSFNFDTRDEDSDDEAG